MTSPLQQHPGRPPVAAIVVTYHPDENVPDNLRLLAAECDRVIVIDNGSTAGRRAEMVGICGVELIAMPENVGVAAALNAGARRAVELGYEWILTLDQDSRPESGMVAALWEARGRCPDAAIVGPEIVESIDSNPRRRWIRPHPKCRWFFQRIRTGESEVIDVTEVITSGAMIDLSTWRRLGGFDEPLFIDYVDIDYCLKVRRAGRSVVVVRKARLHHRLGARGSAEIFGVNFRPMHHPPLRHYYMARNRVIVWGRHAIAMPHWALFDLCFACYNAFRVIAFETAKWAKLKAIVLGTCDGLRGRLGPAPESRRHQIEGSSH